MKKIIIETLTGNEINTNCEYTDTPVEIVKRVYQADPAAARQIFSDQKGLEQMMDDQIDEHRSTFELIALDGESIPCSWKVPLCKTAKVNEELQKFESEDMVPVFAVVVASIVG